MGDETLEAEMAEALKARLAVIGDFALRQSDPERHLALLREASEKISVLEARMPPTVHPQLRHYFERRSYDKALAWIEREGLAGSTK